VKEKVCEGRTQSVKDKNCEGNRVVFIELLPQLKMASKSKGIMQIVLLSPTPHPSLQQPHPNLPGKKEKRKLEKLKDRILTLSCFFGGLSVSINLC
jgi:hypothetical protein